MSKLIGARYLIEDEHLNLASDMKSPSKEVVQIRLWKLPKLDQLVHNAFLRRAKEFGHVNSTSIVPLIDYGYDGTHSSYYVVYQVPNGNQLNKFIKDTPLSIQQTTAILLEVADAMSHLHLNNYYVGYLNPPQIILSEDLDKPSVLLNMAGIEGYEILLGINKDMKGNDRNYVEEDITQLAYLAITMLTREKDPSVRSVEQVIKQKQYPVPFLEFLRRAVLEEIKPYSSVSELKRDLLQTQSELLSETIYYLTPTKRIAESLASLGFIPKPELYIAADFLNQELVSEKTGRIFESSQKEAIGENANQKYSITSQRFRMLCAPALDLPQKALAIISIDCPSPISLVTERELGMHITATLKTALPGNIPSSANILPLLDKFQYHYLHSRQKKKAEIEEKSGLEAWRRVLNLQKKLLDQFQVPYVNWVLSDDENTLLVDLKDEREKMDVSEDERLMMSSNDERRSIAVGYFQELEGSRLKIALMKGVVIEKIAKVGMLTRDNIQVRSILTRQEDGLRRLRFKESVNPVLLQLLLDPGSLEFDKVVTPQFWDDGLDEIQREAVKKALESKDIFLVHGPPGTGKTRMIVELVRQILNAPDEKENKILVTSQSNVAVNHALTMLLEQQQGLRETVVRVGREEKAGETGELMLDQQMFKWAEQVRKKSSGFLELKRKEYDVKPQLAECFSLIDECENIQKELHALNIKHNQTEKEQEEVNKNVDALNELINKADTLRKEASILLEKIENNDIQFKSILDTFDKNYLGWASEFLTQARELSKLSAKRSDVNDRLSNLKQQIEKLQTDYYTGTSIIRESLLSLYKKDLSDLNTQKTFVRDQLAAQQDSALKLGRIQKISQDWCQRMSRGVTEFEGAYLSNCKVIGATCIGVAARGEVSDMEFDWVIVDEAGRSTHPELIVPIVRGRKIVLVGDHRQLPPIVDNDLTEDILEEIEVSRKDIETSLFKEIIEPESGEKPATQIRLQIQYRMGRGIGNLISRCFYDGSLRHAKKVEMIDHKQTWISTQVVWIDTKKIKNHDEHKVGLSYQNIAETDVSKAILDRMETDLARQNMKRSVGIITGYMGQKKTIRQQIGRDLSRWPHLQIDINTVDAFQGQEKDYIIYSVVRSNAEHRIGFLQDERRLNVALSRARELLVIVGNSETAEYANTGGRDNPFYRVIRHIRENPSECSLEEYKV